MLDLSAVLAGGGIVPFVGCVVVTEQAEQITAQAPALPAADAVVEGEKAAEPALPQNIERFGEAAVPQKAEQEAAPGSLISSAGQVEGEGQGAELQVKAEGQHMEQPEGQSEQSGKQPGTDQKMDVEVTQLQTGGDQKLFQGTEAAPVKVGDGAVLDTTSEQFDARLSRTIRSIADQGIQKIELKLTPEHLGNVVVELTRSEGSALHVVLRAEERTYSQPPARAPGDFGLPCFRTEASRKSGSRWPTLRRAGGAGSRLTRTAAGRMDSPRSSTGTRSGRSRKLPSSAEAGAAGAGDRTCVRK